MSVGTMSETQHRIIIDDEVSVSSSPLYALVDGVAECGIDAWYWLVNYVQSAPERKILILTTLAISVLFVALLMKRTRFF